MISGPENLGRILASVELMPGPQLPGLATVLLSAPVLVAVSERPLALSDVGDRLVWMTLAFDITRLRRRSLVSAFYLRVWFADQRVTILHLDAAKGRERPPTGPDPTVSCDGLGTGSAGTLFETEHGTYGLEQSVHAIHALLDVPADLPVLRGTLRADASIRRGRKPISHVSGGEPCSFAVPALPAQPAAPARHPGPPAASGLGEAVAGVRLCLAADIERFSRLRLTEAMRAQRRFADLLARARRHAGVEIPPQAIQVSGDGQFVVLPAEIDETVVIPRLVEGLRIALADSNTDLNEHARLRVRVALHRGHVSSAVNGWIGDSTIAVHRLLDSAPLRLALSEHPSADFALIVPDVLYRDVIVHCGASLSAETFQQTEVHIPAKGFAESAWIHVPT